MNPARTLYLAVPVVAYEAFFRREFAQMSIERYQIKQIVYEPIKEVIVQWLP
nr:element excision factor XisH family protein [Romeria gracilis]